jgi:hypothetical protein
LRVTPGDAVNHVAVDGASVDPPVGEVPSPSELLSAELDVLARSTVYESAVEQALT